MDRNIVTGLGVVSIESFVQCFYVIVQSGPCHTLNRYDTNGVFITHLQGFFRIKSSLVKGQRHFTHFNLPELGELFPYYLETGWDNEIRFIERFALSLAFLAPTQPSCHATQHTCFTWTNGQRTCFPSILFRRVPQVCYDVDTFSVHHGDTGIFRFVNVVDVDSLVHQLGGIVVHISGNESGQIQTGLSLSESFVFYHLISNLGSGRSIRDLLYRRGLQHSVWSKHFCFGITFSEIYIFHFTNILV